LWFLVAEHLRLGSWDLVKGLTDGGDNDISPRFAMQLINEASLCKNRVRSDNFINSQGFELLNGMSVLASDNHIHNLLNEHTVEQAIALQDALAVIRNNRGHYSSNAIAIDPHRIITTSSRTMQMKKKQPNQPAKKVLQSFFANDSITGQPLACGIGSPGKNTAKATLELLDRVKMIKPNSLIIGDKEHFGKALIDDIKNNYDFEFLVPVISSKKLRTIEHSIEYKRLWAGYAIAETTYSFSSSKEKYRLVVQREGETLETYVYKSFLTLSNKPAQELIAERYDERWSIEEFFNFDGAMGFDRASTFNLNIRYNKMSLALIAQAANYEFRKKLPSPFKTWNAQHLSDAVFRNIDGDIRTKDDTIIVTCYNAPKEFNLQENYQNLPQKLAAEGIDPRVPWLYNFKLDFRFK